MPKRQFKLNVIAAATAALFAPVIYAQSAGRVDFATPGVNLIAPGGQSRPAAKGATIAAGETIDTGTGRAQLRFTDGGLVSLQPQTQFRLEQYGYDKDDTKKNSVVMNLLKGGLRTITGLIGKTNREGYKLQTATATVGIRGTEFSVTGTADGAIIVHVADGSVDVSNRGGNTTISNGETVIVTSPNSAPTKTDEKPFLPPLAYNTQTNLAQPNNPVQESNQIAITNSTVSAPKLTGTFQGQWATTTASSGYPNLPFLSTPSFTLDDNGNLVAFGQSGTSTQHQTVTDFALTNVVTPSPTNSSQNTTVGQAGIRSYGNDGIMAWGTWEGGPTTTTSSTTTPAEGGGTTTSTNTNNTTYPASDPLHYVVGVPVSTVPTSGTATYSLYGGTAPTCLGAGCTSKGQITITSSFSLDFAKYAGLFNMTMKNTGDGVSLNTGSGLALSLNSSAQLSAQGSMTAATDSAPVDSSYLYFGGFLAGASASNAGGVYNINYSATGATGDTNVAGAAVYQRGVVAAGSVAGNWAVTTQSSTTSTFPDQPSFYALNAGGALQDYSFGTDGAEGSYREQLGSATAVKEGEADGVLTWGHWVGGPTVLTNPGPGSNTYDSSDPLHYVTGTPVTNMPVTGSAVYSQVGMTTPSCNGPNCGNISVNSSLNVDFTHYVVKLNFSLANDGDGVKLTTGGSTTLQTNGTSFYTNTSLYADSGSTSQYGGQLNFQGFFAGNGATHAGAAYAVNYTPGTDDPTTYIAGALAYKRGAVVADPSPGNWAVSNASAQSSRVGDAAYSTYQLDANGLASYSTSPDDTYSESRGAATAVQEGTAGGGVLTWGHWLGGPTVVSDGGQSGSNTYGPGDQLHYITGIPVASGTMPTTGMASYSLVGGTSPSCQGFACNGSLQISSSMKIDFESYTGLLKFGLNNSADGVKLTTPGNGLQFSVSGSTFNLGDPATTLVDAAGSSGSVNQNLGFQGFLAGAGAGYAGAAYNVNYTGTTSNAEGMSTNIAGTVAYQSGGVVAPTQTAPGMWATAGLGSTVTPTRDPANSYYALDSSGGLERYGAGTGFYEARSFATATVDGNIDNVLTWGRWTGGPTYYVDSDTSGLNNYDPSSPLHYITGTPVTAMPTSGTATFAQVGNSVPSCQGPSCGTISINSSFSLDFAQYSGKLNFAMTNSGDGVGLSTPAGGLTITMDSTTPSLLFNSDKAALVDTGPTGTSGTGNLAWQGFLAGDTATHAGAAYNVNYTADNSEGNSTTVAGTVAYKRGAISAGPVVGSWATATQTNVVASGSDYPSTYQLDAQGLVNYAGIGSGQISSYSESRGSAASVVDGSTADGNLTWGRWSGGPTSNVTNGDPGTKTYSANDPLHWITGTPVAAGTMPTMGMATYSQAGYTVPSCTGFSCGAITINSSMKIDFEAYTGLLNFALANGGDGVKLTTGAGGAQLALNGTTFGLGGNQVLIDDAGSTGSFNQSMNFQGFFAGSGASNAGAVYGVSYVGNNAEGVSTAIAGAIGYTSGGVTTPITTTTPGGYWATATLTGTNTPSNTINSSYTPYYALDSSGALERYGRGDYSYEARSFATATVDGSAGSGILTWGRWIGGPTAAMEDGDKSNNFYDSGNPLHYITGAPVTNMPTSGTATYAMVGGSVPSCGGANCGAISINSSFSLDFASYSGKLNFAMANGGDGVNLTTAPGGIDIGVDHGSSPGILSLTGSTALQDSGTGTVGTSGTGALTSWQGFLAGDTASHAGAAYNVNYVGDGASGVGTYVGGTAAYQRGPVGSPQSAVAGGNWATVSGTTVAQSQDVQFSTGYVLNNQPANAVVGIGSDLNYTASGSQAIGSATAIVDGSDGVMAWGRWTGGPTSANNTYTTDALHYVAGLPVSGMPTSGTGTYNSYGQTLISCSGVNCGGGAMTATSTLQVNFGTTTGTFALNLNNSNSTIVASSNLAVNAVGGSILTATATGAGLSGTIGGQAITGGNVNFNGFLAGAGASNAGGVFASSISTGGGTNKVSGGLVYQKAGGAP